MLEFATREIWAKSRTPKPSNAIADYMMPKEITELKSSLVCLFKHLGSEHQGEELRYRRDSVRQALKRIDKGLLPPLSDSTTEDLTATLRARYKETRAKAYDAIASDNDAWNAEKWVSPSRPRAPMISWEHERCQVPGPRG